MERETFFADIILPLALPKVLTYRLPREMNNLLQIGVRVIVTIGKSKRYSGVVCAIHNNVPTGYEARYIEEILDESPIVTNEQLQLWEWMASYYCATMGDVMNAALPGGLKLSSETKFVLSRIVEAAEIISEKENAIIEAMIHRGALTIDEVAEVVQLKNPRSIIKSLIDKKIIAAEDEIKEKFKPRTVDFLTLGPEANSDEKIKTWFDLFEKKNAHKKSDVLLSFLQLSAYDEGKHKQVDRLHLQKVAKANNTSVQYFIEKKILELRTVEVGRLSSMDIPALSAKPLSDSQERALQEVKDQFEQKEVILLHGVTSSGKTEVYIHLIEETLRKGQQVLFLLPEIALTTQIIQRLRAHFGKHVGIYHSGYSDNERTEVWKKVMSHIPGEYDLIVGARSSIFLPFRRLGLIIVDEEHENSYKQYDPAPRYNARDTAIVLASLFKAKALLGSATPAIETTWNAHNDRYGLVKMTERFGGVSLPAIELADIRRDLKNKSMQGSFTSVMIEAMREALEKKEQIILFQNRRGYTPLWECADCQWVPMCSRCDVSLTYHKYQHSLRCHYCGYHMSPPKTCSSCGSNDLRMLGFGTEKIEEDIQEIFPDAAVQRMDLETTRNKNSHQTIIENFETRRIDILVGTQMVTKGLDFDNVSLVGIMNADKMMNFPDYRSIERSYQLITQVSGRAGRRDKKGKVIIQTYKPDHWLFDIIQRNEYDLLYEKEIEERRQFIYPPFVRLTRINIRHKEESVAQKAAQEAVKRIIALGEELVLGPEKNLIPRINDYYIYQVLLKQPKNKQLNLRKAQIYALLKELTSEKSFLSTRISIDVDPL